MNVRKIKEDLGRVRTCIQRRDFPRAVYLFCLSLKELGQQAAPTPIRGDIRSALTDICADPAYKKAHPQPLSYQPGKERDLLVFFNKFYKQIRSTVDEENYEETLQRKLNMDRCLSDGKAFLNQGKPSEADNSFTEALKYYRDELAVFGMMARAMMEAGQYARALGYVRKGLGEKADDPDLLRLSEECGRMRSQSGR